MSEFFDTYEQLRGEIINRLDGEQPFYEQHVFIPNYLDSWTMWFGTQTQTQAQTQPKFLVVTFQDPRPDRPTSGKWVVSNAGFVIFNDLGPQ